VGQSALDPAHLSKKTSRNGTKSADRQLVLLSTGAAADQIESGQVDSGVARVSTAHLSKKTLRYGTKSADRQPVLLSQQEQLLTRLKVGR
jgi:hypothetical protein